MLDQTMLIAVNQGFALRYFLRTDIFEVLKSSGVRVVIATPNASEKYLREDFAAPNVFIEPLESAKNDAYRARSRLQVWLEAVRLLVLSNKGDLSAVKMRELRTSKRPLPPRKRAIWAAWRPLIWVLRRSAAARRALVKLESRIFVPDSHRPLFEKYRPGLVVVPGLGYWLHDAYMIREAHRHGAKAVSVILSWDNTSTKGLGGARPDYAVAWTETMKQELIDYHDLSSANIFVGGVAHYDHYLRDGPIPSRADLFNRLNLDPRRKLLVFGTGSPTVYDDLNRQVIQVIGEAIARDRFVEPSQLLVRLHPIYLGRGATRADTSRIERLAALAARYPQVHLDIPETLSRELGFDMPLSDMYHLRSILQNADILVNIFSTLMIEASIFDLPVVNACFDVYNETLRGTNRVVESYPHIRRVISTGGVRTAYTEEELITEIDLYLRDRTRDAAGRALLRAREGGPNQGSAGRAIAEHLLRLLGSAPAANRVASGRANCETLGVPQ